MAVKYLKNLPQGSLKPTGTLKTNQIFFGADSSRPIQQKKRMLRSVNCVQKLVKLNPCQLTTNNHITSLPNIQNIHLLQSLTSKRLVFERSLNILQDFSLNFFCWYSECLCSGRYIYSLQIFHPFSYSVLFVSCFEEFFSST